jgi:hypothetical protein
VFGRAQDRVGSNTGGGGSRGSVMPRGGFSYRDNPMNQEDQSSPNLASSIFQGRQEAIRNQPFRRGYEIRTQGPDDSVITSRNPRISPAPPRRRNENGNRRASA